jgi:hypothetical protein
MTKKETFKWIVQIIASVATAILTALGATSCMVLNKEKRSGDLFQSALIIFMQLHDIAFFLPQWRF